MSRRTSALPDGSTLIVTLVTLTALSLMAAMTFTRVLPRFRMAHQNAAWQEARVAAEAGIDVALGDLLTNAAGPTPGSWPGWQQKTGGLIGPVLAGTLGTVDQLLSLLSLGPTPVAPLPSSTPIFLDNLRVSTATGVPTAVDVQLWSLQAASNPAARWFRIRSMATCALPPTARDIPANLDAALRRFSLRNVRPQLQNDDAGTPLAIPLPNISRTVEVLVEPILPFELALCAANNISLSPTGAWCVDSYDSRDPLKSGAGGIYPGRSSSLVREFGSIATSHCRPSSARYGPLIAANGARVRGTVATQGGDDPNTSTHENVSGAANIDPARVRDDFSRALNPVLRPTTGLVLPPPLLGPYLAGPELLPTQYHVAGNLGDFRVTPLVGALKSSVVIMIDGDLVLTVPLIVPPNVTVVLHVRGNIELHDSANSGPWTSGHPGQLVIIGESDPAVHRTMQAYGNAAICAAFYGPTYSVSVDGDVDWSGSITAYDFQVRTGGDGGLHYDEALGGLGPPISYRIARYVEDVRE